MKTSKNEMVEKIKEDRELRPYFIDYLGENLKFTSCKMLDIDATQIQTFKEGANTKLNVLITKLESRVPKRHVDYVLHEVCKHYASISLFTTEENGANALPLPLSFLF